MKRTVIFTILLCASLILALGCERKVTNTIVQDNTFAGADACMECHGDGDLKLVAAQTQWANSKHGEGATTILNANVGEGSCGECHTAEGFISAITDVPFDSSHYSSIGCFTCHAPHTTGTLALRVTEPYTLLNGDVFDHGEANLCVNCHHSRKDVRTTVADSVKLSSRFGPHHGPQGDMLNGSGGYEYDGYTYTNSPHSNVAVDGCIDCHMSPSVGVELGGHTWTMAAVTVEGEEQNLVGCNRSTCHNAEMKGFDSTGVQTSIVEYLDSLGAALYDVGLADYSIEEFEDGTADTTYAPMGNRIVKSKDSTGAVYNYMFVKEDRSEGIHNTEYALGLLQSSLNFIRTGNASGVTAAVKSEPRTYSAH